MRTACAAFAAVAIIAASGLTQDGPFNKPATSPAEIWHPLAGKLVQLQQRHEELKRLHAQSAARDGQGHGDTQALARELEQVGEQIVAASAQLQGVLVGLEAERTRLSQVAEKLSLEIGRMKAADGDNAMVDATLTELAKQMVDAQVKVARATAKLDSLSKAHRDGNLAEQPEVRAAIADWLKRMTASRPAKTPELQEEALERAAESVLTNARTSLAEAREVQATLENMQHDTLARFQDAQPARHRMQTVVREFDSVVQQKQELDRLVLVLRVLVRVPVPLAGGSAPAPSPPSTGSGPSTRPASRPADTLEVEVHDIQEADLGPEGRQGVRWSTVARTGLDQTIRSVDVVHVELRDVETVVQGQMRRVKMHSYFVLIRLDEKGFESLSRLKSMLGEGRRGESVLIGGSREGNKFDLDQKTTTATIRLVIYEEPLLRLIRAVKKPWKDNPTGNSTVNDWDQGILPAP